jgi:hypothetical protein
MTISEPTNSDRAAWAAEALATFRRRTGTDCEDALPDLLCDLMHWADEHELNFGEALDKARDHHHAEVQEAEELAAMKASAPKRPWRVTVFEWHSHVATIETATSDEAFEEARRVLADNPDKLFRFSASGIEAIEIEEAKP